MNAAHFHLMVTHLPIVGLGFALLLNLVAVIRKNPELRTLSCWCYLESTQFRRRHRPRR